MRALSASEAKPISRAVKCRDQRQLGRQPRAEFFLVVRSRRPGLLLRLAVIIGGQFLDAGAEDFGEQRHVRRQHRPHRELRLRAGDHRACSASSASASTVITPSKFDSTSLFQKRSTRNPFAANHRSRYWSRKESACWPPSTSITSRASKQTKSAIKRPIGTCRRNLKLCKPPIAQGVPQFALGVGHPRAQARARSDTLRAFPSPFTGEDGRERSERPGEGPREPRPPRTPHRPSPHPPRFARRSSPAKGEGFGARRAIIARSPRWCRLWCLSARRPFWRVRRGCGRIP